MDRVSALAYKYRFPGEPAGYTHYTILTQWVPTARDLLDQVASKHSLVRADLELYSHPDRHYIRSHLAILDGQTYEVGTRCADTRSTTACPRADTRTQTDRQSTRQ